MLLQRWEGPFCIASMRVLPVQIWGLCSPTFTLMNMLRALSHPSHSKALLVRRGVPSHRIAFVVALDTADASFLSSAVGRRARLVDSFPPFVSCSAQMDQHRYPSVQSLRCHSRG